MQAKSWLSINAGVNVALGIAFVLYSPLILAALGLTATLTDTQAYWLVNSFARLFGLGLLGIGIEVFSVLRLIRNQAGHEQDLPGVLYGLLLINIFGAIVMATQTVSIWGNLAGWLGVGFFSIFSLGYVYLIIKR